MGQLKRSFFPMIALALALVMTFGAITQAGSDEVTAAVQSLNAEWDRALNTGDAAAVAVLYAENGCGVTADGKIMKDRAEVQNLYGRRCAGSMFWEKIR